MSDEVHEGGCLCRSVRYRASGKPIRTQICHCTFCQRMTGSANYAESLFPIDAVAFEGEMARYDHVSDESGRRLHIYFCPKCGTTLTMTFELARKWRVVSRGTFDDPNWVSIDINVWTRSAQTGVALPSNVDCFERGNFEADGTRATPRRYSAPVMARSAESEA